MIRFGGPDGTVQLCGRASSMKKQEFGTEKKHSHAISMRKWRVSWQDHAGILGDMSDFWHIDGLRNIQKRDRVFMRVYRQVCIPCIMGHVSYSQRWAELS